MGKGRGEKQNRGATSLNRGSGESPFKKGKCGPCASATIGNNAVHRTFPWALGLQAPPVPRHSPAPAPQRPCVVLMQASHLLILHQVFHWKVSTVTVAKWGTYFRHCSAVELWHTPKRVRQAWSQQGDSTTGPSQEHIAQFLVQGWLARPRFPNGNTALQKRSHLELPQTSEVGNKHKNALRCT